ncbi:hypothetical protein, partial [Thalassospira lucentensis]|uniref:hypothetical protein n=1 Tax=Thalassospira lucentensis TaxID=168935 RepID=UPI001C688AC8
GSNPVGLTISKPLEPNVPGVLLIRDLARFISTSLVLLVLFVPAIGRARGATLICTKKLQNCSVAIASQFYFM